MDLHKNTIQYLVKETTPATRKKKAQDHYFVLTSIKFPPQMIDKVAEKHKIMGNLSDSNSDLIIKTPFKQIMGAYYNRFDDRERLQTIMHILRKEIDFEFFKEQGVILDHYPLHKQNGDEFKKLFRKEKY